MRKQTKTFFSNAILTVLCSCLMLTSAQAAKPLWTFAPQTPTEMTVVKGDSAQVIYTVQNQSAKPKNLVMKPIAGVSQGAPCQLPAKGSCTLTLNINGSALQGDVLGGPVLCQQGNDLQCYQPSSANILRIRLTEPPPVQQFTVTPTADANGSIDPATAQVVNVGSSLTFTATPDAGFGVNQWLLDGNVVQTGGASFQLNNIQTNHAIEVTFNQTTLSPLTQNLALSINNPGADPALAGNARIIRIENTGSISANNVQVSSSGLPAGTSITNNTCTGALNAGATCDITITPGGNASLDVGSNACTTAPGTEPEPTIVTVSADNAPSTDVNVLVLGYGCIYQGGFLFSVDDSTSNTGSIGGKVAAMDDQSAGIRWGPTGVAVGGISETSMAGAGSCDGKNNGACNTSRIIAASLTPPVAAQLCEDLVSGGFNDWFMPAICELGRYLGGFGPDAGCGTANPNLYSTLHTNGLGGFAGDSYWSSTEFSGDPTVSAWYQDFSFGVQSDGSKGFDLRVRCVRAF